ncbi:hypothetical protein G7K_6031-t1 [Saitoella complicata NRRL Y-17804]|uniref:Rab-GAP TBC domain-containing protein n=2 Tax=Saitoella complicata (strain BCRC 22490 / CBS 7301 / JCM 7358 / NBRC 10748 / NRRL Y-17804) TaxID=698492 RepID=A0A0E9NQ77_SAICN|nr:hypothetical protein G7K_6031-t1 [Saitoella complicata NRRL Y-17804]
MASVVLNQAVTNLADGTLLEKELDPSIIVAPAADVSITSSPITIPLQTIPEDRPSTPSLQRRDSPRAQLRPQPSNRTSTYSVCSEAEELHSFRIRNQYDEDCLGEERGEDWSGVSAGEVDRFGFVPSEKGRGEVVRIGIDKTGLRRSLSLVRPTLTLRALMSEDATSVTSNLTSTIDQQSDLAAQPTSEYSLKESSRTRKWAKMALKRLEKGNTTYTFPTTHPKLLKRTFKGIPDCWRSSAWLSFLSSSASQRRASGDAVPTDAELLAEYERLQDEASPCDPQIDLDVPRTIHHHLLFRRRYSGGQRLLFRVLHALSLHFPHIGYVQGMASLIATLLCYYTEELAFVVAVRVWEERGVGALYEGEQFGGLMRAFAELGEGIEERAVGRSLEEKGVEPIGYATRWYLTLFSYTVGFRTQLRIWDVFMLGPAPPSTHHQRKDAAGEGAGGREVTHPILQAVSLALMEEMVEHQDLLHADFERAMRVLGGRLEVEDDEVLMRRVWGEWRAM